MTDRPLIGITSSSITHHHRPYNRAYQPNALAIAAAGGLPVYIPTHLDDETLRALYETLDGVLLPGGPDVDPSEYQAERHPLTIEIDAPRDALELTVARWAVDDDVPVFGICRGHQVLNVALGGTLVQDIPSELHTNIPHDQPNEVPRTHRLHEVSIAPDSRLADILGGTRFAVNSLHHQSVDAPAPGVRVTAAAPDGVVEAIEHLDRSFVLSVQWHPEDLVLGDADAVQGRLFAAFVAAASARKRAAARAAAG